MTLIEIIVLVSCVLIVGSVIAMQIVNKKKGKTSCGCDCSCCSGCSNKNKIDHGKKSQTK